MFSDAAPLPAAPSSAACSAASPFEDDARLRLRMVEDGDLLFRQEIEDAAAVEDAAALETDAALLPAAPDFPVQSPFEVAAPLPAKALFRVPIEDAATFCFHEDAPMPDAPLSAASPSDSLLFLDAAPLLAAPLAAASPFEDAAASPCCFSRSKRC